MTLRPMANLQMAVLAGNPQRGHAVVVRPADIRARREVAHDVHVALLAAHVVGRRAVRVWPLVVHAELLREVADDLHVALEAGDEEWRGGVRVDLAVGKSVIKC
jgi:hypothetical protein